MERSVSNHLLEKIGTGILEETQKSKKSLLDIFGERVVSKLDYHTPKKAGTFSPPEVFEIARHSLDTNYKHSSLNFAIIAIYKTLDLNPDNAVEKLRPFIEGPHTNWLLRQRLVAASLAIAEDYLGLKRDVLYNAFALYKD